ncbi:hypothetical protein [Streptomyces sp. NBC_01006]|uniref:hypothetical protein n=1 Tax=Streptomyces sp. NBC_01006 TaxID=2903716 RepID=UPI002F909C95|nr:hypothetical protein OG509_42280 [Streptomyces sp. NBC_01006]
MNSPASKNLRPLRSAGTRRAKDDRQLPRWLREGAVAVDDGGRRGVVQFIGEWEDPATRRINPCAIFLRPEGGGVEWIVADHVTLTQG